MEHIIQFGVTIDDDAMKKLIEEKAAQKVADKIYGEVTSSLPKRFGRIDGDTLISRYLDEELFQNEEIRKQLIDTAADILASKTLRSKAWRQKRDEVADVE